MSYCFCRVEKVNNKSKSKLSAMYNHNYREIIHDNVIGEKIHLNEELVSLNGKTYSEAIQDRIQSLEYYQTHSVRKNNVLAFDVLTEVAREEIDSGRINLEDWKNSQVEWLRETFNSCPEKYGDNVLSVMFHGDETGGYHCHAVIIPIDKDGKLCADFYLSNRISYTNLQDSYGKKMHDDFNLERGLRNTKATHKDIKRLYAELNHELYEKDHVPIYTKEDTLESYREKIVEYVKDLKGSHVKALNDKEREIIEADAKSNIKNEKIISENTTLKKEIKREKKVIEGLEHELGKYQNIEELKKDAEKWQHLQKAVESHPDLQYSNEFQRQIEEMEKWGKRLEEMERKKKEKETRKYEYR